MATEIKPNETIYEKRTVFQGTAIGRGTRPAYQAYRTLHFGFTALPIIAGVDKFFNMLVNWDLYLAPLIENLVPFSGHDFMLGVGVIEIAAGILVAVKPTIGAYVVAGWLWAIIANLLFVPGYYDIALRDFGLSLGAIALARLSEAFDFDRRLKANLERPAL